MARAHGHGRQHGRVRSILLYDLNTQSITAHFDEIQTIFSPLNFHAILISETWLTPSLPSSLIQLDGFTFLRNDRLNKRGGGTGAYIRSDLNPKIVHFSNNEKLNIPEMLFIELILSFKKCLLCVIYQPPKVKNIIEIESSLQNIRPFYENIILMGDLNINILDKDSRYTEQLITAFQACDMTILPLEPTHHTRYSETLLDIISTNNPDRILTHGQVPAPGISGHDIIYVAYSLHCPKITHKTITYRDLKCIDDSVLTEDAMKMPWHTIWSLRTVDEKVETLNDFILQLYDKHAPLQTRRVKRHAAPWMTTTIRNLMTQRDAAYRTYRKNKNDINLNYYKQLRNKTTQAIRNAKLRHMYSLIQPTTNSSNLWNNLNRMGLGKTKNQVDKLPVPIDHLNDHFTRITTSPTDKDQTMNELRLKPPPDRQKFYFSYLTEFDVKKAIKRIKTKAQGTDRINITLLNKILDIILPTITHIFNASLITSTYPSLWKHALVRPLPKVKNPSTANDFRPISILPTLSKALERIVHKQLTDYLNEHNLFDKHQSGFRTGHNVTTALLKVNEDIREASDNRKVTLLTLLDFSKAFDSVDIDLLLYRLKDIFLSESVNEWFSSYLRERQQCIVINNSISSWKERRAGVPQGSVLGPLLFTIYINDIADCMKHSKYHLFADDMQIYLHSTRKH